jgi:hypothetical protein
MANGITPFIQLSSSCKSYLFTPPKNGTEGDRGVMPDALPSADGERLDGLKAGAVVPLIGPLTEAALHGLGDFDGEERGISTVGDFVGLIGGEVGATGKSGTAGADAEAVERIAEFRDAGSKR